MDKERIIQSLDALLAAPSASAYDAVKASIIEALMQARADERDRCALVCEEMTATWTEVGTTVLWSDYNEACMACANAIRKVG